MSGLYQYQKELIDLVLLRKQVVAAWGRRTGKTTVVRELAGKLVKNGPVAIVRGYNQAGKPTVVGSYHTNTLSEERIFNIVEAKWSYIYNDLNSFNTVIVDEPEGLLYEGDNWASFLRGAMGQNVLIIGTPARSGSVFHQLYMGKLYGTRGLPLCTHHVTTLEKPGPIDGWVLRAFEENRAAVVYDVLARFEDRGVSV